MYEEFSIWMALAIVIAIGLQVYFMKKRKEVLAEQEQAPVKVEMKPLSFWKSPFPYLGIAFFTYIGILILL